MSLTDSKLNGYEVEKGEEKLVFQNRLYLTQFTYS